MFRYYLQRDVQYRNSSFMAVAAINHIYILAINHSKLDSEVFIKKLFHKQQENVTCSTVSWGEANIQAPSRDIKGEKLILNFSFDNRLYFLALKEVDKEDEGNYQTKCEWVESSCFELHKRVVFCQQMKKSEVLIITEENCVKVFHTKNFDIFERPLREDQIEMEEELFHDPLEVRMISGGRRHIDVKGATEEDLAMLSQGKHLSYADTFLYEYPSN